MLEKTPGFINSEDKERNKRRISAKMGAITRKTKEPVAKGAQEAGVDGPQETPPEAWEAHAKEQGATGVDDPHDSWDPQQFEKHQKSLESKPMTMSGTATARFGPQITYKADAGEAQKTEPSITEIGLNKYRNELDNVGNKSVESQMNEHQLFETDKERRAKQRQEGDRIVAEAQEITNRQIEKNVTNEKLQKLEQVARRTFAEHEHTQRLSQKVKEAGQDKIIATPAKKERGWLHSIATAFSETTKPLIAALAVFGVISSKEPPKEVTSVNPPQQTGETTSTHIKTGASLGNIAFRAGADKPWQQIPTAFSEITVVKKGKPWVDHIIKERLSLSGVVTPQMSKAQVNAEVAKRNQALRALSTKELKEMGFKEGNIDKIYPGDRLNLSYLDKVV